MADNFPPDWMSLKRFIRAYPNLYSSEHSARWEMRHRHQNGLIRDSVVVERRADPNASRPSLLISPSRYFDRLTRLAPGVPHDSAARRRASSRGS